jgi:glycosyltransferase involved in cell wall biosynthesis
MKARPTAEVPVERRGLLIYDADRELDTTHPLWNEIMLYAERLEEVHVFVFIKKFPAKATRVVHLSANTFVYYLPGTWVVFRLDTILPLIKYNMVWNKTFRPDFILNHSTHSGALLGLALAKRYRVPYVLATLGGFLEMPVLSREFLLHYILARCAQLVVVPGDKVAHDLSTHIGVRSTRISVVPPAVDLSFLGKKVEAMSFAKKYPFHNFFLVTQTSIGHRRDIMFLMRVFRRVLSKYPKTALVFVVPKSQVDIISHIVTGRRSTSSYVYAQGDDIAQMIAGGHAYLSTSETQEMAIPVVRALSLHVPVVATSVGIAKDLFVGTRYARFMVPVADEDAYTQAIIDLIENQQLRDEYRLNTTTLIATFTPQTPSGYVAAVVARVVQEKA